MTRHGLTVLAGFLAGLALLAPRPTDAKQAKHHTVSIDIEGDDGERISLSLSSTFVDGLIRTIVDEETSCDSHLDPDAERMLRHLDTRGEGSRYTLRDGDREVRARRRRGRLELDVRGEDRQHVEITLPWAFAECLLGKQAAWSDSGSTSGFTLTVEDEGHLIVRAE